MERGRPHYAIIAGLLASMASVFGKLISYTEEHFQLIDDAADSDANQQFIRNWTLKIVCLSLMFVCNVLVWTFFVKSLHERGGSLIATLTSTATNYCCSAAIGCFIFAEETNAYWWLGTALVIIGLVLISMDNEDSKTAINREGVVIKEKSS